MIADEIAAIAADPMLARCSIGVISLIGHKQAELVSHLLIERVGVEAYERHRILCGDARHFQGQERDIVFLSLVASPGSGNALTTRDAQQRFNVAVSRARDRLVLVRSLALKDLKNPDDLRALLMQHFQNPATTRPVSADMEDLCESGFERQVFRRLRADRFRVTPQVQAGAFRLDLVVEGADDKRLAIELDGDAYHGPERFAADQRRQKALERIGWTFWRCWYSDWRLDADGCYAELRDTLVNLGIEPLGDTADTPPVALVRHEVRRASPPNADLAAQLDLIAAGTSSDEHETSMDGVISPDLAALSALTDGQDAAQVGDRVALAFDDDRDRLVEVELSEREHRPEAGIVHVSSPLARVILEAAPDEEIVLDIEGRLRPAVIKRIDRASSLAG